MSKIHEIGQKVQSQTLDAVRMTQDAVVEAVTAWAATVNKIPGYTAITKQWPVDNEVIDVNFDFAQKFLDSNRDFAGRIISVTTPKAAKQAAPKAVTQKAVAPQPVAPQPVEDAAPKAIAPKPTTKTAPTVAKKIAPAPAKKLAPRKSATAAKKSTAASTRTPRTENQ